MGSGLIFSLITLFLGNFVRYFYHKSKLHLLMTKKQAAWIAFFAITIAAIFTCLSHYNLLALPGPVLLTVRWLATASLVWFAIKKRSLTT